MTTKLNIGDKVIIENKIYLIKKIIITANHIKYLVNGFPMLHLCDDEFWESDFDKGIVLKIN